MFLSSGLFKNVAKNYSIQTLPHPIHLYPLPRKIFNDEQSLPQLHPYELRLRKRASSAFGGREGTRCQEGNVPRRGISVAALTRSRARGYAGTRVRPNARTQPRNTREKSSPNPPQTTENPTTNAIGQFAGTKVKLSRSKFRGREKSDGFGVIVRVTRDI